MLRPVIIPNVIGSSVDAATVDAFFAVDAFSSDKAFSAVLQELKHTLNHQRAFSYFTPQPGPFLKHIFSLLYG